MSSVLATNFHRNPLNLKNLNIFFKYVFLFKKQFDDKIFKTYRTRVYINNVDNDYDLFFYIVIYYFFRNNIKHFSYTSWCIFKKITGKKC